MFDLCQTMGTRRTHIRSMNQRTDRRTALLIDAAVHAAASHGKVGAAQELIAQGVHWEVVMRVLNRPEERRHHWPLEPASSSLE
jgi:hypothetical protein